ncbi:MAG: class I SAM-dependent methyltransferase [Syntrophaceae bacterium]|nr:class I SAM-dependent methyltransferase [Syntrophaceae bacterium]
MADHRGYQLHLSKGDFVLKNKEGRRQKFKKIFSVLQDFCPELQSLKCLDIGCSSGIITSLLGQALSMTIGMDIDQEAVNYAKEHHLSSRIQFLTADAMSLPFKEGSFDVIICNHIYEHVPNAHRMMDDIFRVLKEDGFCYFSAGNKYMIMEGHYALPFLSWLPKPLAHLYLKLTRKGGFYYEDHYSLRGLKKLVKRFHVRDYTLSIIKDPERFSATDLFNSKSFSYKWIRFFAPFLYPWIPTYIWVLTRKG